MSGIEPRLTPADIAAAIVGEDYHVFPGTTVTVCMLTLRNGAKMLGHNYGSIDPARQDWQVGKAEARKMAEEKVWDSEGYLLRERLHAAGPGPKYTTGSIAECAWRRDESPMRIWPVVRLHVRMKDGKQFTHSVDDTLCGPPGALEKRAMTELLRIANEA